MHLMSGRMVGRYWREGSPLLYVFSQKVIAMFFLRACLLVGLLNLTNQFVLAQTDAYRERTWTDNSGKYRLQATFAGLENQTVLLEKSDGSVVRVPLDRLSQPDREVARSLASRKAAKPASQTTKMPANLKLSAKLSKRAPDGVIVFSNVERQRPIFATLEFHGSFVANAVRYGRFQFNRLADDQGKMLKLLKPISGQFNENLQTEMAEVKHFFLERPDLLHVQLTLEKPSADARQLTIEGSAQFDVRAAITIDNVLAQLKEPLAAPGLEKIGRLTASRPRPGEAEPGEALAIDLIGDRTKVDDVELLDGEGQTISTGGTGMGSRRQARIIRWTGHPLPRDTKLRIILAGEPQRVTVPIKFSALAIDGKEKK